MKKFSLTIAAVIFTMGLAFAQDNNDTQSAQHDVSLTIPKFAILDVENAAGNEVSSIAFNYTAADLVTEAGAKLNFGSKTNSDLYLQYTSIVSNNKTNVISAKLASGSNIPSGISLKVKASNSAVASSKKGDTGTGGTEVTLVSTGSGSNVVTGIGSCYTGSKGAFGHQLTYTLEIADTDAAYQSLNSGSYSATVVYTITEN